MIIFPLLLLMLMSANAQPVLVEFFDYQCPHCRHEEPIIRLLKQQNPKLKLVQKVIPVFGFRSRFEAAAALASHDQHQYPAFHQLLMAQPSAPTPKQVLQLAQSIGLNIPKLMRDMQSQAVQQRIDANVRMFASFRQRKIPLMVIGDTQSKTFSSLLTGETREQVLQQKIEEVGHG